MVLEINYKGKLIKVEKPNSISEEEFLNLIDKGLELIPCKCEQCGLWRTKYYIGRKNGKPIVIQTQPTRYIDKHSIRVRIFSEETKMKIRLGKLGEKNPFYGKHHTEKTKKDLSKILTGKKMPPITEETRKNMSLSHLGKKASEETKKRMSESYNYEKHITPEFIENARLKMLGEKNPMYGKHHTEKSKKSMSKNNGRYWLGKSRSEKVKKALKEARKKTIFPLKDSSIEVKIQNFLKELKIEFFTHQYMHIEHGYQCDIFIPSIKTVIECDGDYWHGNNKLFSDERLNHRIINQREIDKLRTQELIEKGFRVIRLWEHEIRKMDLTDFERRITI